MAAQSELDALDRVSERLDSTSNEKLEEVLALLLPKLMPLSNNTFLRPKTLNIFSRVLKRIKPLKTILPITELLKLVTRTPEETKASLHATLQLYLLMLTSATLHYQHSCLRRRLKPLP